MKHKKTSVKPGWVYLIHARGTSRYKIGITTRSPQDRFRELNGSQSPFPLELVKVIRVLNVIAVERHLHQMFSQYRVHGEWFQFQEDRIFGRAGILAKVEQEMDRVQVKRSRPQRNGKNRNRLKVLAALAVLVAIAGYFGASALRETFGSGVQQPTPGLDLAP